MGSRLDPLSTANSHLQGNTNTLYPLPRIPDVLQATNVGTLLSLTARVEEFAVERRFQ
jgi:hypothetical protein